MSKLDEALQSLNKAIELDPKYANAFSLKGQIYTDQKKFDLAVKEYDKALGFSPSDATIHYKLALCLAGAGKAEEGLKAF